MMDQFGFCEAHATNHLINSTITLSTPYIRSKSRLKRNWYRKILDRDKTVTGLSPFSSFLSSNLLSIWAHDNRVHDVRKISDREFKLTRTFEESLIGLTQNAWELRTTCRGPSNISQLRRRNDRSRSSETSRADDSSR